MIIRADNVVLWHGYSDRFATMCVYVWVCGWVKVKEADLYSAFIEVPYTQGAQVRITQC